MATTRLQLFRDIADELGDLVELTASADGSTTTFTAGGDMLWADGGLNGREVWYATAGASSTNNKATRRMVVQSDFDTSTITVYPPWPQESKTDDVVLLVNTNGTGVTIPEIHRKINQLVRQVSRELAPEVTNTPAAFNALSPSLEIPDEWDYVLGVQVEERRSSDVWTMLVGDVFTVNTWDTPQTLTVNINKRGMLAARRVRLVGAIALPELHDDADTTVVPAKWLAMTAAYQLIEAVALRSGDIATAFTYGEMLKQQATELRQYIGRRYRGRRIDLRR